MNDILLVTLLALQVADAYTTILIIRRGGVETNPLLLKLSLRLQSITGARWAWLAGKTVLACAIIIPLWYLKQQEGLIFLTGWYGAIVFTNYLQNRGQNANTND